MLLPRKWANDFKSLLHTIWTIFNDSLYFKILFKEEEENVGFYQL